MDFLKWLLKASFILALMFLGVKSEPENNDREKDRAGKLSSFSQILNLD